MIFPKHFAHYPLNTPEWQKWLGKDVASNANVKEYLLI